MSNDLEQETTSFQTIDAAFDENLRLVEIDSSFLRSRSDGQRRRWYQDEDGRFEVTLLEDKWGREISWFQVSYDERSVTWNHAKERLSFSMAEPEVGAGLGVAGSILLETVPSTREFAQSVLELLEGQPLPHRDTFLDCIGIHLKVTAPDSPRE